jgi:hypothetical protein
LNSSREKETRKMRMFYSNNSGNKKRYHDDRNPEEKILSEQNQEREKGRKLKEKDGID